MHKIFISYSRADYDKVMILKNEIEQLLGVGSCWVDLDGIESDQQFVDVIIDAIDKADIFLFMYSRHSDSSEWTRKEINYAHSEKKRIVFVKLENVQLSKYFRFQFGEHDIIDLQDKKQKEKLLKNLSKWCNVKYHSSDENVNSSAQESGGSKREKVKSSLSRLLNISEENIQKLKEGRDFEEDLRLAEQGDAVAQVRLGDSFYYGFNVLALIDEEEAVKWYRKGAERDNPQAQRRLGECYYYGKGVVGNDAEAVKWWRKAAEQGDVDSQEWLGFCYFVGEGVEQNYVEAVKWYRMAAEQNSTSAQYDLGCCYAQGDGVIQNHEEAVKWWRKAAVQGDKLAITALTGK